MGRRQGWCPYFLARYSVRTHWGRGWVGGLQAAHHLSLCLPRSPCWSACICSSVCLYLFTSVCSLPLPACLCLSVHLSVSLLLPHLCRPGRERCDLVESTRRQGPGGGPWQAGWGDPAPSAPRSCTPTWWSTATTTCWTPRLLTWCPRSWPARPWSSLMRPTTSVSRERGGEARWPLHCCCVRLPEPGPLSGPQTTSASTP